MKVASHPCGSCPYRRDSSPELWHVSEFDNLKMHDDDPINGKTFGCHRFRKSDRKSPDIEFCAGWVLDQRRRRYPSIMLRLAIFRHEGLMEKLQAVTDGGFELYDSIAEMCEANGLKKGVALVTYRVFSRESLPKCFDCGEPAAFYKPPEPRTVNFFACQRHQFLQATFWCGPQFGIASQMDEHLQKSVEGVRLDDQ